LSGLASLCSLCSSWTRAIKTSPLFCYILLQKTQTKWHWKSVASKEPRDQEPHPWINALRLDCIHSLESQHWTVMPSEMEAMMNQAVNQGQYRSEQQVRLCQTLHTLELVERRRQCFRPSGDDQGHPISPWT
jgi:hypothetical protein